MVTIYLTADEQKALHAASAARKQIKIVEEKLTTYETDAELDIRFRMSQFQQNPAMQTLAQTVRAGGTVTALPDVPADVVADLLFTLGARGTTALIDMLLPSAMDAEGVELLGYLTTVRHALLKTNAEVHYVDSPTSNDTQN